MIYLLLCLYLLCCSGLLFGGAFHGQAAKPAKIKQKHGVDYDKQAAALEAAFKRKETQGNARISSLKDQLSKIEESRKKLMTRRLRVSCQCIRDAEIACLGCQWVMKLLVWGASQ